MLRLVPLLVVLMGSDPMPIWSGSVSTPGEKVTLRIGPLKKGRMYRLISQGSCVQKQEYFGIDPSDTYFPDDPPEPTHYTKWVPARDAFGAGLHIEIDGEVTTTLDAGGKSEETRVDFLAKGRTAILVADDDAFGDDLSCSYSLEVVPADE